MVKNYAEASSNGAIGARGEGLLTVGEKEYPVLFTNRALAQAEAQIDKPVMRLLASLQENALSIRDVAQLLAVGMEYGRRDAKAGGRSYTLSDAWEVMDALGFTTVAAVVLEAMATVLGYSKDEEAGAEDEVPPL